MIAKGTKIKLIHMHSESQMPYGLLGIINFIDDANHIHVSWQNGSSLALIPEVDKFEVI